MSDQNDYLKQRLTLIEYLNCKVKIGDWHGVSDAANDLRVLEALEEGMTKGALEEIGRQEAADQPLWDNVPGKLTPEQVAVIEAEKERCDWCQMLLLGIQPVPDDLQKHTAFQKLCLHCTTLLHYQCASLFSNVDRNPDNLSKIADKEPDITKRLEPEFIPGKCCICRCYEYLKGDKCCQCAELNQAPRGQSER